MAKPYSPEQYNLAKESVANGSVPADKLPIVQQRMKEFESSQPSNPPDTDWSAYWKPDAPAAPTDFSHVWDATPEQAEQQKVDFKKSLTVDDSLKNASKLKALKAPPEYDPPKTPGILGSLSAAVAPAVRFFEPGSGEFRQAIQADPRVAQRLKSEFHDANLDDVSDDVLMQTDTYKVYSDARWQKQLAESIKRGEPIYRVAFSDKDWMGGGEKRDERGMSTGARKPSWIDPLDMAASATHGYTQGMSMGLADPALTAIGATGLRDEGRGSADRHPYMHTAGELVGALGGLPGRLFGALGKVAAPRSIIGRVAKGAAVGAVGGVIDDNVRSAARLAADAMDAGDTASEALHRIHQGLPGLRAAAPGAVLGAGADAIGALAGKAAEGVPKALGLERDIHAMEHSGAKMNAIGSYKPSALVRDADKRASRLSTSPENLLAEESVQPLAVQMLKNQEANRIATEAETGAAQAGLEGVTLPVEDTANSIRAGAQFKAITPTAEAQQRELNKIANKLAGNGNISVQELDEFIDQVDAMAKINGKTGEPVERIAAVAKKLRDKRDEFGLPQLDERDIIPETPAGEVTADIAGSEPKTPPREPVPQYNIEPVKRDIAQIRDEYGNVKNTQGYPAMKTKHYQNMVNEEFNQAAILGRGGRIAELKAKPKAATVEDKGVFSPKSDAQVLDEMPLEVDLDHSAHEALKQNVLNTANTKDLRLRDYAMRLSEQAGPKQLERTRAIKQIADGKNLDAKLAGAIQGLGSTAGKWRAFINQSFRTVPTLKALSGGLPTKTTEPVATDWALKRFREFASQLPDRLPGALKKGAEGAKLWHSPPADQPGMMPDFPALHLRAGYPARLEGARQDVKDGSQKTRVKFTPEEQAFWTKVAEALTEQSARERSK